MFTKIKGQVHLPRKLCIIYQNDISSRLAKTQTVIDWLSVIWKSDLFDKMKTHFFSCSGCFHTTIWMHHMDAGIVYRKNLDGNCIKMLQDVLNKSWKQNPTKQQLYGYFPSITKTIQIRQTRHAGHCWRSKDELITDILLWSCSNGSWTNS